MFDYNSMMKRVVDFFPRWMDIRKRYTTSTGGKMLGSIVEELVDVEDALNEYKKYYFLDTYEGHEDDIVAFAFKANIGEITDMKLLSLENPSMEVTTDIQYFLANTDKAYYESGFLYFRTETVSEFELAEITYSYEDFTTSSTLVHTHIWNIFDEFACFCNLQRQDNETNKQLVKRILYHNKNLPNATEDGLKNAIISELLTMAPDIEKDDIQIRTLTATDLHKPYKSFNSLLDKLAEVNRDVYKEKRWDLDYWKYDFQSIEYIDHAWDEVLQVYQNGIGSDDDLKVVSADANTTTDVNLYMYQKSAERVKVYTHDKKIPKKIKFNMMKYNNVLTSSNVKYKITASEAVDITNKDIELTAYDESRKLENRNIQDIFRVGSGVTAIDNSKITDYNNYRLEIVPDSSNHAIEISKINVLYKNKVSGQVVKKENLLKQSAGFILNANNVLVNTSMKKGVTSVNDFNSYTNLINSSEGITVADNAVEGSGVIDITGMEMKYFSINHYCDLSPIPQAAITLSHNAFWSNDVVHFKYDSNLERTASIDIKANQVSFDVLDECQFDILVTQGGQTERHVFVGPGHFETTQTDTPVDMNIKVVSVYEGQVRLSNFMYNNYEVKVSLSKGSLLSTSTGQYMLPGFANNSMTISLKSASGNQPVLRSIYIGSDLHKIKYYTAIIPPMDDCDRIFEVTTNGQINLLHVDPVGNELNRTENYNPATLYKAIKDDAFIRLNLNEYTKIENIVTTVGYKEVIEESGVNYYQIRLKNGESISQITIDGYKETIAKAITLLDMVKAYIPNFDESQDKIYASKAVDGLIIRDFGDNPVDMLLDIKYDIFSGIVSQKFKMTKLPSDLSCSFIISANSRNESIEHNGTFSSIRFTPRKSDTYIAVNDYNLLMPETRNIEIVNNFNPELPADNSMMLYSVEPMTNNAVDFDVRFNNTREESKLFEELYRWTIGKKKIAIKSKLDLNNAENYSIDKYDIEEDTVLAQHIDIQKTYSTNGSDVLFSAEHIIIPPEDTEIIYKTYDPSKLTESESLIKYEEIVIQNDGFNKLKYSNIDFVLHLSTQPYSDEDIIDIEDYTLIKDAGIIVWTNKTLINSAQKIYIKYVIKEPVAFKFDLDVIYRELGYDVEAYNHLDSSLLRNVSDGTKIDLYTIPSYEECDLIHASCATPGFESVLDEKFLTVKKTATIDSILVKSGYYYINGREYYMLNEKDSLKAEDIYHIDYHNIDRSGGELEFVKATNNFVKNSEMRLKGLGEISNIVASKIDLDGISNANALTACNNFNDWTTFSCKLSLSEGLNDVGILFSQQSSSGYGILNITDSLYDGQNFLSLHAEESLSIYIGTEESLFGLEFPRNLNVKIEKEILKAKDSEIRTLSFTKDNNKKYFLVVRGDGLLDDIIIRREDSLEDIHEKNINKLKLEIDEQLVKGYRYIMNIKDNKGVKNTGAGIDSKGYIVNTTKIDWGVTLLEEFTDREGFLLGEYDNVSIEKDYISTASKSGVYYTAPVFLNDPQSIKRVFYKINELDFKEMEGFKTTLLTASTENGDYIPVSYHNDNIGFAYGDYLSRYVKLKIEMPKNKVIDNIAIFSEYKSTENHAPKAYTDPFGELVSKVYDAHYSANFRVRDIRLAKNTAIKDFDIYVRASRDKYSADVWMPWKQINIDEDLTVINNEVFKDSRFFQFKIKLKNKDAKIKFNGVEIEVI